MGGSAAPVSTAEVRGRAREADTTAVTQSTTEPLGLPETPSRMQIAQVLGELLPGVRRCAGGQVGMALATLMLHNDGSVQRVSVGGAPFGGTPQGACMEAVLQEARFSPFRQTTFRVQYPMRVAAP